MNSLIYFFRESPRSLVLAILAGLLSGASNVTMLATVNQGLHRRPGSIGTLILSFAGMTLLFMATRFVSSVILNDLSKRTMVNLQMRLSRQILDTSLRRLEEVGAPRLMAAVTQDVSSVASLASRLPGFCLDTAMVAGSLVYLGWLSLRIQLIVVVLFGLGIAVYRLISRKTTGMLAVIREHQNTFFGQLRTLIDGNKELKLNWQRRKGHFEPAMEATATKIRSESRSVEIIYSGISAWIIMIFYVVVGTLVFAFPATTEAQAKMITGSLLVVFFLRGHLEGLLGGLQTFTTSNVAMRNLESLGLSQPETVKSGSNRVAVHDLPSWRRLEIVGAAHSYPAEEGSGRFVLGPLHLAFTPGQVVFVSGGNGSGKTTLAKLLTGLYVPESGQIVLDGEPIDDRTREQYRQHFSAVFFDFFVFDEIVSANPAAADASACEYLSQLRLSHKVTVTNGVLSTTKLSQGQRKRLALLMAYLEDRPIYVFDEWAADQDPQFKDVFYLELLPRLRARDKTVFVISHDDRYYHVADRVIKLDYGQVEQDFVPISAETSVHAGGDTN